MKVFTFLRGLCLAAVGPVAAILPHLDLAEVKSYTYIEPTKRSSGLDKLSPCAIVAETVLESHMTDEQGRYAVDAPLALECLHSIPLDLNRSAALIDYVAPFAQFQSHIHDIANPPEEYLIPGVDIMAGLKQIKHKVERGDYKSQYEFVNEVMAVMARTGDAHFYLTFRLADVFRFAREIGPVVAISSDGLLEPKLFMMEDIRRIYEGEMFNVGALESIDDEPVEQFFSQVSTSSHARDPDAQWNEFVTSAARAAAHRDFKGLMAADGKTLTTNATTIKFENGTTLTRRNIAIDNKIVEWRMINSGEDLMVMLERYGPGGVAANIAARGPLPVDTSIEVHDYGGARKIPVEQEQLTHQPQNDSPLAPMGQIPHYPYPIEMHRNGQYVSGYHLNTTFHNDTFHRDIGVLVLSSFRSADISLTGKDDIVEFMRTIESFFTSFAAQHKRKLVIDLSDNGGGYGTVTDYLFRTIFPNIATRQSARLRATNVLNFIGNHTFDLPVSHRSTILGSNLDPNGTEYKAWDDAFGPVELNGDSYTNLISNDWSAEVDKFVQAHGMTHPNDILPEGYLKPEDIVIVTDGTCASACALFVGWMTRLAGVRTVAMGGRRLAAPMQAIGGTKGGVVLMWVDWARALMEAVTMSGNEVPASLVESGNFPSLEPPPFSIVFTIGGQNLYHADDEEGLPLHFRYEAANCKLYFTAQMVDDVSAIWEKVADVAWRGGRCVEGSTTNADGTMGNSTLGFSREVWSTATWPEVPGGKRSVEDNIADAKKKPSCVQKRSAGDKGRMVTVPVPETMFKVKQVWRGLA